eukprot:s3226_g4.t1
MEAEEDDAGDNDTIATSEESEDDEIDKPEPDTNGSMVPIADKQVRRQIRNFSSPQGWKLLESVENLGHVKNNVRMMPSSRIDTSWALEHKGALLFDGFNAKIPAKPLEDFKAFFAEPNALQAQSSLQNGGDTGPARHKISTTPATYTSVLETRDWTCPDERRLRESFWLGTEWAISQETFMESLPKDLASFDSKRFFCERYSAVKPLFQCVGVSPLMMSRFLANYEGVHFVSGVGLCELAQGIQDHPTLKDKATTFLDLCEAMVMLTKEELWGMGGFAVTLQPRQVLEIPAGFVVAQTSLSATSIFLHWTAQRRDANFRKWGHQVEKAMELLNADLARMDNPDTKRAKNFLDSTISQLKVSPHILKWAEGMHSSHTEGWEKKIGLPPGAGLGLESLNGLLETYHKKKKNAFKSAVQGCQNIIETHEKKGDNSQYWPMDKLVDKKWDASLRSDMCSLLAPAVVDASETENADEVELGQLGVDVECARDILRAFVSMPYTPHHPPAQAQACATERKADDASAKAALEEGKAEAAVEAPDQAPKESETPCAGGGEVDVSSAPTPCRRAKLEPQESEPKLLTPAGAGVAAVSETMLVESSGSEADADAEASKEMEPVEFEEKAEAVKAAEAEAEDADAMDVFDSEYFMRLKSDDLKFLVDSVKKGPHFQRFVSWMIAKHAVDGSYAEEWGSPDSDSAMELEDFSTFAKATNLHWDPFEVLSSSSRANPITAKEAQCPSQQQEADDALQKLRTEIQSTKQRSMDELPPEGKDGKEPHRQDLTAELVRQAAAQAAKEKSAAIIQDDDNDSDSEHSQLFEAGGGNPEAEEDDYENGGDSPQQHARGRGRGGRAGAGRGRRAQPKAPKSKLPKVKKPKKN